jgi:hypothetical protein
MKRFEGIDRGVERLPGFVTELMGSLFLFNTEEKRVDYVQV